MFQTLTKALPQVKAGNTYKIGQIIYSLYRAKRLLKKFTTI